MTTLFLRAGILLLGGAAAWCGDWNPRRAADYLDAREKAWVAWPTSKSAGGNCVSCHTNVSYLMARPALRKLLGETQPTEYETGLLDGAERANSQERAHVRGVHRSPKSRWRRKGLPCSRYSPRYYSRAMTDRKS